MNVWEVEESRPVEEEPPKRKRRTQSHDPISERESAGNDKPWKAGADQLVGISENVECGKWYDFDNRIPVFF